MTRSTRHIPQRILSMLLILTILLVTIFSLGGSGSALALSEVDARSQIIRVYLSRIGITDRMDITLTSPYELHFGNQSIMRFPEGSELAFILNSDNIYLYFAGMSLNAGTTVSLTRYALSEGSNENGFRRTNFPALYEGDLNLSIVEGNLRPILSLHIEDYLLGVVPYEMSNSFPLEALKAQTIAARTYAMRKQNPSNDYDVVDTTNDQVYKGYLAGNDVVEQAVRETRGICGFYQGSLAQCYYAASNGGQTEQVATVWPTRDDYGYYSSVQDPYDIENPESVVRSITVNKKSKASDIAPYSFRRLIATQLEQELISRGYDTDPASVRIDSVSDLSVHTPNREDSQLMTMLDMTVTISGRTRTENTDATAVASTNHPSSLDLYNDPDTEEVSLLFAVDDSLDDIPDATPAPSETPAPEQVDGFMAIVTQLPTEMPSPSPSPMPTPAPIYGEFTPIEQAFTLALSIFTDAERPLGLDISSNYENEIWSVVETSNDYTIQARRYGHGVGMSQRGAQWMASEYHKTYEEILAFYYPGLELRQYPESDLVLPTENVQLASTPGPAPSPTPRPTNMPTTGALGEGQWYALVSQIDDDSSLNMRGTPELSGKIIRTLYKNQRLIVIERCQEEGWVKVQTDVLEGYVMEKFLTQEDAE